MKLEQSKEKEKKESKHMQLVVRKYEDLQQFCTDALHKWVAVYWGDNAISSYPTIGHLDAVSSDEIATYLNISGTEYEFTQVDFVEEFKPVTIAVLRGMTFTSEAAPDQEVTI